MFQRRRGSDATRTSARRWVLRGLATVGVAGAAVLTGGAASAESGETTDGVSDVVGGLLGPVGDDVLVPAVDDVLSPVLDDVVAPVVEDVVAPVTTPVVQDVVAPAVGVVAPVVEPVLDDVVTPVVTPVGRVLSPVTDPLLDDVVVPVLEPVQKAVAPVTNPVKDVLAPVTDPIEDAVAPITDPVRDVVAPVLDPEPGVIPAPAPHEEAPVPGVPAPVSPEPVEPVQLAPVPGVVPELPENATAPDDRPVTEAVAPTRPSLAQDVRSDVQAAVAAVTRDLDVAATALQTDPAPRVVAVESLASSVTDSASRPAAIDAPALGVPSGDADPGTSSSAVASGPAAAPSFAQSFVRSLSSESGTLALFALPALAVVWLAARRERLHLPDRFLEIPTSPA